VTITESGQLACSSWALPAAASTGSSARVLFNGKCRVNKSMMDAVMEE
jgi:hypothetical protein